MGGRELQRGGIALAGALIAAAVQLAAPPANAAVFPAGGRQYVIETATVNPGGPATGDPVAVCPGGARVLSGGFSNSAPFNKLWLNASFPAQSSGSSGYHKWFAHWQDFDVTSDTTIRTYAICDDTKPKVATDTFDIASNDVTSASVKCPGDRHVVGGGGRSENHNADLISSYPFDGPDPKSKPDDGWRVQFDFKSDFELSGEIWALCADPMPAYRSETEQIPLGEQGYAQATCPADGKRFLVGGGERTTAATTQLQVNASNPFIHNVGSAPSRQWIAYLDNRFGGEQDLETFAICAKKLN